MPNCYSVAYGLKETDGKLTTTESIIFFVTKKVDKTQLKASEIIPRRIDGIITDVKIMKMPEAPRPLTRVKKASKKQKIRPAPCGVSIGHKDITAGSQGWYMIESKDEFLGLSNNHVKANENLAKIGDSIYQPGPYDGGTSADTLERLFKFEPILFPENSTCPTKIWADVYNKFASLLGRRTRLIPVVQLFNEVDAALGKPLNQLDYSFEIYDVGEPAGIDYDPPLGTVGLASGRTTCLTNKATLLAKDWMGSVGYSRGIALFTNQYVWQHNEGEVFSQGGDSGKVIMDHNTNINSLLFAGSDTNSISNPIGLVEKYMGYPIWYSKA